MPWYWKLIIAGGLILVLIVVALYVIWYVRQTLKDKGKKRFDKGVEETAKMLKDNPSVQRVELHEKDPLHIDVGERKAVIEQHLTKEEVEKPPPEEKVVSRPDLILPEDVTQWIIETKDNKKYKYKPGYLEAKVVGKFFRSKVVDSISGEKRYAEGGDRILPDEIIGVIKKGPLSGKILQRVSPEKPVMFIRFLVAEGQDVQPGTKIAYVGIAVEKKQSPVS